jgi:transcriptional regulator with XRE-family HTH domain
LLPVEPFGVGSALVESLTSYIARLAAAHAVRVSDLAGYGLAPCAAEESPIVSGRARHYRAGSGFHPGTHAINGLAEDARRWIAATETATGRTGLKYLTLTPFQSVFTKQGLFRKSQAWCPVCFDHWRQNQQTIYLPLLWHLRAVNACAIHRNPLREVCPHCCLSFGPLYANAKPGFCSRCHKWLGKSGTSEDCPGDDLLLAHVIGETLAIMPQLAEEMLPDILRDNLVRLVAESAGGSTKAFSELTGIASSGMVGRWLSGEQVPRTDLLFRICFRLGISPAEMLRREGNLRSPTTTILLGHLERKNRHDDPENMKTVMRAALNETPPPSLSDVAARLRYRTCGPLRRLDAALVRQIAERYRAHYRQWYKQWAIRGRLSSKEEVEAVLRGELVQDQPKPVVRIAAEMGQPSATRLTQKFPTLCKAITAKRRKYSEESRQRYRAVLESAIREEPPPLAVEVARHLGTSQGILQKLSPELYQQLRQARANWKAQEKESIRRKLEACLHEMKGASVPEICRATGVKLWRLFTEFPVLYKEITAAYWDQLAVRRQARRDVLRHEVRQAVSELLRKEMPITIAAVVPFLSDDAAKDWNLIQKEIASAVHEIAVTKATWRA